RPLATLAAFFFSSRRRHTRWPRDWSSDVCSSDLLQAGIAEQRNEAGPVPDVHHDHGEPGIEIVGDVIVVEADLVQDVTEQPDVRSEERRVGKECRCGGAAAE